MVYMMVIQLDEEGEFHDIASQNKATSLPGIGISMITNF